MSDFKDIPSVHKVIKSPCKPDLESIRHLFDEFNVNSPDNLWDLLERLTHLWAAEHSAEACWV